MKFLHLADLHIGKKVNEFSMLDEQKYIFQKVVELCEKEEVAGAILAGDIYDKSIPSVEAIELFENFIEKLRELNILTYIVSGNHDSVERLSAFSNLIEANKIYISKMYNGTIKPITNGNIDIWLLPFVRPLDVRRFHPDIEIGSYNDAVKQVIQNLDIDKNKINILVAHQFVTANGVEPEKSESEISSLGTLDNVDFSVFDEFDYVALGHIHKPQSMGRKTIRYCGSPLKYSFSEVNQKKSFTIIDISKKNDVKIETFPIIPKRDIKEKKGSLDELLKLEKDDSYMHITLTDVNVIDAKNKLEVVFPNIMKLDFEDYEQSEANCGGLQKLREKSLKEHFSEFFEKQTHSDFTDNEEIIISELLTSVDGGIQ